MSTVIGFFDACHLPRLAAGVDLSQTIGMLYRFNNEVTCRVGGKDLAGHLAIPETAERIVIFSHGSGSSRLSPRNMAVADYLNERNTGTFLFDLLTGEEAHFNYFLRFDIGLLTKRLVAATRWLQDHKAFLDSAVGYFGASTGAASALLAAAEVPEISAVVSRGGRPDLAASVLPEITIPVLLIVGGLDTDVLELNKKAYRMLGGEKKLEVIPRATHLFEEPGTLEKVMEKSADWFDMHLHPITL